ncbi:MAG TPA: DUF1499 domain-containing protein [Candidatus Binataceae bacterium]|nr:DUF1499 domain-containing protein [Candidatus Binataceae bacterium]
MIFAWLAFFDGMLAFALVAAGILGAHFYFAAPFFGFQLFLFGFLLSIVGFVLGPLGILMTRSGQRRIARPRALVGTALSAAIAIPVLVVVLSSAKYPAINDITTDFENPPEFVHAEMLVPNQGRDLKYSKEKYMPAQQRGYAPLVPGNVAGDPAAVFDRVRNIAATIPDWQITYTDPATMTIEGVCVSHLFHFQDDFIIQVRSGPNGMSLVEMRSKSRDGVGDFGVNYNRIVMFMGKLQAAG